MKTTKIKSFDLGHMHVEEDFGFQKMVSVEVEHLPYVAPPPRLCRKTEIGRRGIQAGVSAV